MKSFAALLSLLTLTFVYASPGEAFPPSQVADKKCTACHTLDREEARRLLAGGVDEVLSIGQAPIEGMFEIVARKGNQKFPLYVDYGKEHVFTGNIIRIADHQNLTSLRMAELNRVDVSQIPMEDALLLGDKGAKKKVIVFTDPECPYCKKLHEELKEVIRRDPQVAFQIKLFPLKMHPNAYGISKSIVCADSLELLEASFAGKPVPPPTCDTDVIDRNLALGQQLGINSTPVLILPDGMVLPGFKKASEILELLGSATPSR